MSNKIVSSFSQSYYYIERKNLAPLGKLYFKYRNWKNKINRTLKAVSNSKGAKPKPCTVTSDEDAHIRALKHDFHAMTYDEKLGHWAACAATRMKIIRDVEKSSKQIIDVWPQYKAPDGFRLVSSNISMQNNVQNNFIDMLVG